MSKLIHQSLEISAVQDWDKVISVLSKMEFSCLLLQGDLGSGKTTFVKHLVKALGSEDSVTSPTFSLVNIYEAPHIKIVHMDLYRLESYEELFNAGIEEYLSSDAFCIIEWPEILLKSSEIANAVLLTIQVSDDGRRQVEITSL